LAIGVCCPLGGASLFTIKAISALSSETQVYSQILALPPDKRIKEFTKRIVYDSIRNLLLRKGLKLTPKVIGIGKDIVQNIAKNKPLAKNFTSGTKAYLKLLKRYPKNIAQRTLATLKQNPSLVEKKGSLSKVAQEVGEGLKTNPKVIIKHFNRESLQKHFKKHVIDRAEWGVKGDMTIDKYLAKARELLNMPVGKNIEGFVSKNGFTFRYNKLTNEFATAKPDGTIETLFRPKQSLAYWKEQVKTYKS